MLEEDIDDDELDENIENDELDRIYIEPPEVGVESDEDSADEDEAGLVDNLSGRQLRAGAIACFRNGNRIGEQDLPPANSDKNKLTWDNDDINVEQMIFPDPNFSEHKTKTPTQLFEIFFNDNVWALLVSESSHSALFLNQPDPKITIEEFQVFIGRNFDRSWTSYKHNFQPQKNLSYDESMIAYYGKHGCK